MVLGHHVEREFATLTTMWSMSPQLRQTLELTEGTTKLPSFTHAYQSLYSALYYNYCLNAVDYYTDQFVDSLSNGIILATAFLRWGLGVGGAAQPPPRVLARLPKFSLDATLKRVLFSAETVCLKLLKSLIFQI